jgi:hypothetical protein
VRAEVGLLVQHHDAQAARRREQRVGDRQSDDPATDDGNVSGAGHGNIVSGAPADRGAMTKSVAGG